MSVDLPASTWPSELQAKRQKARAENKAYQQQPYLHPFSRLCLPEPSWPLPILSLLPS